MLVFSIVLKINTLYSLIKSWLFKKNFVTFYCCHGEVCRYCSFAIVKFYLCLCMKRWNLQEDLYFVLWQV